MNSRPEGFAETPLCQACGEPLSGRAICGVCARCLLGHECHHANGELPPGIFAEWSRRFQFIEIIGKGGIGAVYKAVDPRIGRVVALKIVPINDPATVVRVIRESKIHARLRHPNIVPLRGAWEGESSLALAMELVEAGSLSRLLSQAKLSMTYIRKLSDQLCSALHYAHRKRVIHRDIKPSNLLIDAKGDLLVADFGLAKFLGHSGSSTGSLTQIGDVLGTPFYMAPEQANGHGKVDCRADIYSAGVVIEQMLKNCDKPRSRACRAIRELENTVAKATAHDPDRRFRTIRAFNGELERIWTKLLGEPTRSVQS